jgi:hypothetical protein
VNHTGGREDKFDEASRAASGRNGKASIFSLLGRKSQNPLARASRNFHTLLLALRILID